ncbi:MAG: hypothetical protein HYX47_12015 [Burkholderiales bacterium]|nr:hypothetical protein [Burkholderiales bacterium]
MTYEVEDAAVEPAQEVAVDKSKGAGRRAGPPRLAPIYLQHKRKVPPLTFELAIDGLPPLALRALQRLPRHEGVPVLRGLGKEDDAGFSFQFRMAPRELTAEAVPALLERWDEKYEVAKARAGLNPAPPPEAEPLRPRAPRRARANAGDAAGTDGSAGASLASAVADLGIVQSAISAHDAQVFSSLLSTSAAPAESLGELDSVPVLDGGAAAAVAPPAAPACGTGELFDHADTSAALESLATIHIEFSLRDGGSDGAGKGTQDDWRAWTHALVRIEGNGMPALQLRLYPMEGLDADSQLLADGLRSQSCAEAWKVRAEAALAQSLDACLRMLTAPDRLEATRLAINDLDRLVGVLDVLLLDMQLCAQLVAAIDKQQLGMAGWALGVRQHLQAHERVHHRFHVAPSPGAALDLVDRWAGALAPMRLTEQAGLFAEQSATHLQRQLNHLVEHARAWTQDREKGSTRDECARVFAVWATWARALPELARTAAKKPPGTLLNRRAPGSD